MRPSWRISNLLLVSLLALAVVPPFSRPVAVNCTQIVKRLPGRAGNGAVFKPNPARVSFRSRSNTSVPWSASE